MLENSEGSGETAALESTTAKIADDGCKKSKMNAIQVLVEGIAAVAIELLALFGVSEV